MSGKNNEQGAILLIALLIISGLTAIGLGVSVVIFTNLRSTSVVDNSIAAIYSSESGMEWSLEQVAEARSDGTPSLATVMSTIQAKQVTFTPPTGNGASWKTNESNSLATNVVLDAAEGKSVQLDLFDPGNERSGYNNIKKISISAVPTSGWAEVSWVAWNGNSFISNSRTVLVSPSELGTGRTLDLYGTGDVNDPIFNSLTAGQTLLAYRVNVKARFGDLNDVTIQALDGASPTPNVIPIPNRVFLKSRGASGGAAVALTTSIPWRLPTSSLFDFVIFSDESIEK